MGMAHYPLERPLRDFLTRLPEKARRRKGGGLCNRSPDLSGEAVAKVIRSFLAKEEKTQ